MHKLNTLVKFKTFIIAFTFFFGAVFSPILVFADENPTITELSSNIEDSTSTSATSDDKNNLLDSDSLGKNDPSDWTLDYPSEFDNYYVFDNLNRSQLYKKNELITREDPLALNILISLLAIENLDVRSSITISNEIAIKSEQENLSNIILNAGSKYEVIFLIYATLFYDSKAALEALALNLSESIEEFQTLINTRLRNLNMDNSELIIDENRNNIKLITNSYDMGNLLSAAYTNTQFKNIFTSSSDIYVSPLDNQDRPLYLRNRMDYAWTWTRNDLTGALSASNANGTSFAYIFPAESYSIYILQYAEHNGINFDISGIFNNSIIEATAIRNEILTNFIQTPLVQRGDYFDTIVLENGIQVELIYLSTVYYLKPTFVSEIIPQISVNIQNSINLPIIAGERLGTVNIILANGDSYSVEIGSNSDIYSQNNFIEDVLTTISENENIVKLIYSLFLVLLIVIVIQLLLILFRRFMFSTRNKLKK